MRSAVQALRAHKGGVTGLAIHPSGALAISVGRDRGLRLWDLLKGCAAAAASRFFRTGCMHEEQLAT